MACASQLPVSRVPNCSRQAYLCRRRALKTPGFWCAWVRSVVPGLAVSQPFFSEQSSPFRIERGPHLVMGSSFPGRRAVGLNLQLRPRTLPRMAAVPP